MNYLLDTHALIWALATPDKLSKQAREVIEDPAHIILASSASAWEIAIKLSLKKIKFPLEDLERSAKEANFTELKVSIQHAVAYEKLPLLHRDPFDRLLIAQAQSDGLVLLTRDSKFAEYGITVIW